MTEASGLHFCLDCWNATQNHSDHECAGPSVVGGRSYPCQCECQRKDSE